MAHLTFFTKRLIADMGYTPESAGTMFMALGWSSLICGVLWGWIADAIGREWAAGGLADALPAFTTGYLMAAGVVFLGAIGMHLLHRAPRRPRKQSGGEECPPQAQVMAPPV